jgi:hypothetical protein
MRTRSSPINPAPAALNGDSVVRMKTVPLLMKSLLNLPSPMNHRTRISMTTTHRSKTVFIRTSMPVEALRRTWEQDEDFVRTVQIRTIGDREKFPPSGPHARFYTVLDLRDAKFWPMNFPINWPTGRWCTILINRKPPHLQGDR